jgi:predicted DNA-binding transcriptional regulator YafY
MLEVPYADETELLMDVLRHGDQVEVIQPGALREAVQRRLAAALAAYAAGVSATEPLGLAGNAGRE